MGTHRANGDPGVTYGQAGPKGGTHAEEHMSGRHPSATLCVVGVEVDHPVDAEAITTHAVVSAPELTLIGHDHGADVSERVEDALPVPGRVRTDADRDRITEGRGAFQSTSMERVVTSSSAS